MSKAGDPRLGDLLISCLRSNTKQRCKVALLGYPCDVGVERNSGRVGAKYGPDVIRDKLYRLGPVVNPERNIDLSTIDLRDRGNTVVTDDLEANHAYLVQEVQQLCDEGFVGVIIGGGNDQSYPNCKGLMSSLRSGRIGVVNIDAHFDVRPLLPGNLAHSGSPFRLLLEDNQFKNDDGKLVEFACQGNQCSSDHASYIENMGGQITWLSHVKKYGALSAFERVLKGFADRSVFVSFDIDSIQGADCPGVSCPGVRGLTAEEAFDICFAAGKHSFTRLLDLSEFNPKIEEDRTARLVVNMIYYFLMGVASR